MNENSVELFRQDGTECRLIRLSKGGDGIRLGALDMGSSVERFWSDDDYEFWVDVANDAICKLAFALLRHHYAGRADAVDEFRAFCKQNAIEHKFENWI